jgi:predicted ATPase
LLPDVWLAELSRLLPELRERYPDLPPPATDEKLARARLPEAVTRLGQALAQRSPVALLIDDLQWADDATLDVLRYACRAWSNANLPLLLLFTLRSEALATMPEIESWLAGLNRDVAVTQLSLQLLTPEETQELVSNLAEMQGSGGAEEQGRFLTRSPAPLPLSTPAHFAAWLYKETTGQPFFISETIRALPEQNWTPPPEGILPPGVRQVILARLKALPDNAGALLTAAAVIGRPCAFETLCQITGLPELAVLPDLEQLLNRRLLLETNNPLRPYQFTHDKIRDVVYTEAGDARRRLYHQQALQSLETSNASPAELAHHALAARLPEPAFRYGLAAGDEAMSLFAIRGAIAHYEQARHQLSMLNSQLSTINLQSPIPNLYIHLARAYELLHNYAQAEAICRELLNYAEKIEQPSIACVALNRLASIAIYSQQMDKAAGLLAQAKQTAEAANDKTGLAQTEWHLGQLTHHINDFDASKEHCERALALAQEINDPALIAGASNSLGHALIYLGQVARGATVMEMARDGFAALGNRVLEADSLVGLAKAQLLNGQIEAATQTARSALVIGEEIENDFGQAMSRARVVCGLVEQGDYEEALRVARQNLAATEAQEMAPKMVAAFSAGLAYWAVGDYAAAQTIHLELMPHLEKADVPGYLEQNYAHLCVDAALAGDWETAHAYARQALALRDYRALPLFVSPHWPETEALLRGGDIELACEDTRRWGALVGHIPRYRPLHLRSLALLAEWDGDAEQAIIYLQEALTLAEAIGLPGEQWPILAKLGELYQAIGNEEKARSAFEQATEIIQALAAKIDDEGLRTGFLAAGSGRQLLKRSG